MSDTPLGSASEQVAPETAVAAPEKTTMDIVEIMAILPHRYPFLLIDRVIEMERKTRIVAIKNVTVNEPHFTGHFPDYPIMPGVLMMEAMAQAGGALLLTEIPDRDEQADGVYGDRRGAKFRRPVVPGDQLRIEVTVLNWRTRAVKMKGVMHGGWQAGVRGDDYVPAGAARERRRLRRRRVSGEVSIHPTAIVAEGAVVPASCTVGPFCTVGANVVLGEDCELVSHVVLDGHTTLGRGTRFIRLRAWGSAPQDLKYAGEPTRLEMGDDNTIREYVTISRGTVGGGGVTRVGSGCLIMAYAHIGHDSQIGNGCILANAATLAGHVTVEDYATLSAQCAGAPVLPDWEVCYIGGGTTITQDVLPYSLTSIERNNHAYGLNKVGLERRGFTAEQIRELRQAYAAADERRR